jgi:hypothetical protein
MHALENIEFLLQGAVKGESGEGYCERLVDDMLAVSN